jgi:hypothetical protein
MRRLPLAAVPPMVWVSWVAALAGAGGSKSANSKSAVKARPVNRPMMGFNILIFMVFSYMKDELVSIELGNVGGEKVGLSLHKMFLTRIKRKSYNAYPGNSCFLCKRFGNMSRSKSKSKR